MRNLWRSLVPFEKLMVLSVAGVAGMATCIPFCELSATGAGLAAVACGVFAVTMMGLAAWFDRRCDP